VLSLVGGGSGVAGGVEAGKGQGEPGRDNHPCSHDPSSGWQVLVGLFNRVLLLLLRLFCGTWAHDPSIGWQVSTATSCTCAALPRQQEFCTSGLQVKDSFLIKDSLLLLELTCAAG